MMETESQGLRVSTHAEESPCYAQSTRRLEGLTGCILDRHQRVGLYPPKIFSDVVFASKNWAVATFSLSQASLMTTTSFDVCVCVCLGMGLTCPLCDSLSRPSALARFAHCGLQEAAWCSRKKRTKSLEQWPELGSQLLSPAGYKIFFKSLF